jgi:lysophospholipase L1-like esterase
MPFFISVCASPPRGIIVLCAGDSITAEAYPHFLQRILNGQGILARVLNYGRSGNASGEYLRYMLEHRDRIANERPDFVLLELGTNDVRVDGDRTSAEAFKANMKKIMALFRSFPSRSDKPPIILLASIPPIPPDTPLPFTPESSSRVIKEINPAIREISAEEEVPLVDNFGLFVREPGLLAGVHPSREGYRRLAENWFQALRPYLKTL